MTKIAKGTRITGDAREILAAEVIYRYERGASIRTIADDTGRGYGTIHRLLVQHGIRLRSKGGMPRLG